MSAFTELNLARRPFRNARPRRRLVIILWTMAGILLVWNAFLFARYWVGSSSGREALREVRADIDARAEAMRSMQSQLQGTNLEEQNQRVRFLNLKIAQRTFPWSQLFDDLVAVLPRDVRLDSLAPAIADENRRSDEEIPTSVDWIDLAIRATARTSDDALDFIDAMFEAPAFSQPVLINERERDGEVEFDVFVLYHAVEEGPEAASEEGDETVRLTESTAGEPTDATPPTGGGAESASARAVRTDGQPAPDAPRGVPSALGADGGDGTSGRPSSAVAAAGSEAASSGDPDAGSPGSSRMVPARGSTVPRAAAAETSGAARPGVPSVPASGARVDGARGSDLDGRGATVPDDLTGTRADAEAAERYGRDRPVAPRLRNASGSGGADR